MSLSSLQLDAFFEVARLKSFSAAAKWLHVTQSALSQRIGNLEAELGTTLFIREPSAIRLTPLGHELLLYCRNRKALEEECLSQIANAESLVGMVRIGAYSTITRSIVIPGLAKLMTANPGLRFEITSKEMRDLPDVLRSGEVDFILLDHELMDERLHSMLIGHEEYVLIESSKVPLRRDVCLDHDEHDETTSRFFANQDKNLGAVRRSFLDEIYAIIDGVAFGFGRAVVPKHLIKRDRRVRIVKGLRPLLVPVYVHYYSQRIYSKLQKAVINELSSLSCEMKREKSFLDALEQEGLFSQA